MTFLALALAAWFAIGCGHALAPQAVRAAPSKAAPPDPEATLYANMRTANNDIDVALQDLEDGMKKAKSMAPSAGGQAKTALNNVASLLNSAGEGLSDYDDVPATLDDFKKDFAAQDENRLKGIDAAVGSLQQVDAAADILDDLSANVPADRKEALGEISDDSDEAIDDLRAAIKLMGGTVPAEDEDAGG